MAFMVSMAAALAAASQPCHSDTFCNTDGGVGWRCTQDGKAPLPASNCHLPGPYTAGNSTCSCGEQVCGKYPAGTAPPAGNETTYLMIGDSISLGQFPLVQRALASRADPWWALHSPGNAASANLGAHCLASWLDVPNMTRPFDVISFNFGLHDIGYDIERLAPAQYTTLLEQIADALVAYRKAHGTKLLYFTTTPVPNVPVYDAGGPCANVSTCVNPPRYDTDVRLYNSIAVKAMAARGIPVSDLYTLVSQRCGGVGYKTCTGFQLPNNVHYTAEGWQALSDQTLTALLAL